MTLLRKLATGISRGVVRLAPTGAREWAQATAGEIEFIESDWRALRWALGSVRILGRSCAVPMRSMAQAPQAAADFLWEIRMRTVLGCAACVFVVAAFTRIGWHSHYALERIGAYLSASSGLYMIGQLLARRPRLPLRAACPVSAIAFRAELERQRDFHAGFWFWSRALLLLCSYCLSCAGTALAHPSTRMEMIGFVAIFAALTAAGVRANRGRSRQYQRRIDELDRLERPA